MAKTRKQPSEQIYEQLFASRESGEQYPTLQTYLSEGGSIFPLVDMGVHGLEKTYRMSTEDAQAFLRRASSMAIYLKRRYIEATLIGDRPGKKGKAQKAAEPAGEVLSMVPGPSYETLFRTDFGGLCPPAALESRWSPVAYLVELLQWVSGRIEPEGNTGPEYLLHNRRTDLKPRVVDFNAVFQSVSAVEIINRVLEGFITTHGPDKDLVDALLEARYPNDLPYYQHWVTVDSIAAYLKRSVGDFAHTVNLQYPYFLQTGGWNDDANRALTHSSRLGPYQRTLLTEPPKDFADRSGFYRDNFGTTDLDFYTNLNQIQFLGERTGLTFSGVEALLSIRAFAPVRSPNVKFPGPPPTTVESERFGSVYLNANAAPPIAVHDATSIKQTLTIDPSDDEDFKRFDRLNRKVRLDKWLNLRSHETDVLLVAAINAETRGGAAGEPWWISRNVVHALGLFQLLREQYGCKPLEFAACLDEMSVYGIGDEFSLFDQVFNDQGDYRQPLNLDGESFPAVPAVSTQLTIDQLCNGLQIDLRTYAYLAPAIASAQGLGENLQRSKAVVSAFYRLVKLARLFGMTPVELVLMLTLMGGKTWLEGLAGLPQIHATAKSEPDVLQLIYALHACTAWCKERNLPVLTMLQMVAEPQPSGMASEAQLQLFEKVGNLLPASLLSDNEFLMADVPSATSGTWLDLIPALVDARGLVKDYAGTEADYLIEARKDLDKAATEGLPAMDDMARSVIVEKMLAVLLQFRDAQRSVAREALAVFTSLDPERALWLLTWADTSVHTFLSQIDERIGLPAEGAAEPLLNMLANVQRLGSVVLRLDLSGAVLRDYLDYGYNAWLGQENRHAFSMSTLYSLSMLPRAFELSEQQPQELLDYLRAVANLPTSIGGDSQNLAREASYIRLARFFRWSVQEVRETVRQIDPVSRILKNLQQLDMLMRVRTLAESTGMDAWTVFLLGQLPENTDKARYADAAEHVLLSQREAQVRDVQPPGEVEQLVVITCTLDKERVVAGKPGEKATYTLTIKDAKGVAMKGVWVFWNSTLGTIAPGETDNSGVLKADFLPGKVLGVDTPSYWLDLFKPVNTPAITVVADSSTLAFPGPLKSRVPLGAVPVGEEAQLYAVLRDEYKNPGADETVTWSATPVAGSEGKSLVFRPSASQRTNQQGQTSVFVHAPAGGTFKVSVKYGTRGADFDPVTFASAP